MEDSFPTEPVRKPSEGQAPEAPPPLSAQPQKPAAPPRTAPARPASLPPRPAARISGCWIAILAATLIGGAGLLLLLLVVAFAASNAGRQAFIEEHVQGYGTDKVAVIELGGVILEGRGFFGDDLVERVKGMLRQAAGDPNVQAVVLAVDSPGGGVTASDVLYNEVVKVQKAGKKVVVHMGSLCASGGYYVSASADSIIASPTTTTGSIGVIFSSLNAQDLLENKLGVKTVVIKSGPKKDLLSFSRSMTPEELKLLQGMVDEMYDRFCALVMQGRAGRKGFPADEATFKRVLADGSIFTGEQAVAKGLADGVGYLEDAFAEAMKAANLKEAAVVRYKRPRVSLLAALLEGRSGQVNINTGVQVEAGLNVRMPRFEYRWTPGE